MAGKKRLIIMNLLKNFRIILLLTFLVLSLIIINPIGKTNLHFGLDIEGGIWSIIKPVDNVSNDMLYDIKAILEERTSTLRESSFQIIKYENESFIQIQIAGGSEDDLQKLINTTGVFEAKIPMEIRFENGNGKLKLGEEKNWIDAKLVNENIIINNEEIFINNTFVYDDVNFVVWNITDEYATVAASVYKNKGERKDVIKVYTDPKHSFVQAGNDFYEWQFDVEVTPDAAERFYKVVKNIDIKTEVGQTTYLASKIYLYLDDKEVNNLSIGASLRNKPTTMATVSGSAKTREQALEEKRWLQLILRSGALPSDLEIISMKTISPKLGENFLYSAAIAMLAAIITVSCLIFIRYKSLKITIPVISTCLSEIIIILGSSVVIGWTLDLAAIAGIIAIVGTGVDHQIVILDEVLSGERTWSLKGRIKNAFFIIFGAAGTTIGAMLPLLTLGFGLLRGFAIVAIIGILIGVFITRPAFAAIVENIMK